MPGSLYTACPARSQCSVQVDINEQEPLFLKGNTARSGREMSPVRVVKNPDGSMQRAALTQTALAKERREIRRQQERSELEAVPQDISKPWEDPLAHADRCARWCSVSLDTMFTSVMRCWMRLRRMQASGG